MSALCAFVVCLHLVNVSSAAPALVADAKRQLVATYDAIGVDVGWSDEPGSILLILRDDEPRDLRRPAHPILGVAIHGAQGSPAAYVFYRRAAEQADCHGVSRAVVIAATMAHEVGHLLLPSAGHAAVGLMRASWDDEEFFSAARGDLRFLPGEAALLRVSALRVHDRARGR
jgi:hypothetical protein